MVPELVVSLGIFFLCIKLGTVSKLYDHVYLGEMFTASLEVSNLLNEENNALEILAAKPQCNIALPRFHAGSDMNKVTRSSENLPLQRSIFFI